MIARISGVPNDLEGGSITNLSRVFRRQGRVPVPLSSFENGHLLRISTCSGSAPRVALTVPLLYIFGLGCFVILARAMSSTDLTAQWLRRDSYIFPSHFIPFYTPPSGTRQTPKTVFPSPRSPYTAPFPVRSISPPHLFLCMQRPTRMQPVCLGACIVSFHEAERFLRDLGITGPPGEHLPYWDQIPYTRFLFDFW